jgi:hypothetical protein
MKALPEAFAREDRESRPPGNFKALEMAGSEAVIVSARIMNVLVLVGVTGQV